MDQKKLLIVIFIILVIGIVGYFALVKNGGPIIQQTPTPTPAPIQPPVTQPPISAPTNEIEKWKIYRNEKYGFELKYPQYLTTEPSVSTNVKEYREKVNNNFEEIFKVELEEVLRVFSEPEQSGLTIDIISGKAMNDFISSELKREVLETWYYDATPPELLKEFIFLGKRGVLRRGPGELSAYNSSEIMLENRENQIIRMSFYAQVSHEDIERVLEQIFSTFKFI